MSFGIGGSLICERDNMATREEIGMPKVAAGITTSVDGYITGPKDGPERGLGEGGERLHYWVFGGPWTYAEPGRGDASGADKEYLDDEMAGLGAVVGGRGTFDAADGWGGTNPWPVPFFIVTHRPQDEPPDAGFTFVVGLEAAIARARSAAGDKDVHLMGGADVIRQALRAGYLDELSVSVAPVVLGAGKRLFDGFDKSIDLELIRTYSSPFATHIKYRVVR
jgi:dihydrofolate reductase